MGLPDILLDKNKCDKITEPRAALLLNLITLLMLHLQIRGLRSGVWVCRVKKCHSTVKLLCTFFLLKYIKAPSSIYISVSSADLLADLKARIKRFVPYKNNMHTNWQRNSEILQLDAKIAHFATGEALCTQNQLKDFILNLKPFVKASIDIFLLCLSIANFTFVALVTL